MTTSMGDQWLREQTLADNAAADYEARFDATLPRVLAERKQAIRDALRAPNADVLRVLTAYAADHNASMTRVEGIVEEITQRLEALIVRVMEGDTFGQVGMSVFTLAHDLVDTAAREGLDAAVAAEIARNDQDAQR